MANNIVQRYLFSINEMNCVLCLNIISNIIFIISCIVYWQEMHLKGQMVYLAESNSLLFLGSPVIGKLDELIGKGLFVSDIPIHDATRDVILVGEQTKAQVGHTSL